MRGQILDTATDALARVLVALDSTDPDRDEQIREHLLASYNSLVEQYRPLLPALVTVARPMAKDLAPIISTFLALSAEVMSDDTFVAAHGEYTKVRAALRMAAVKIYVDAGFSREEAFVLILDDINSRAAAMKTGMQSSSARSSGTS